MIKQLRERTVLDGQHVDGLICRWTCETATCPNKSAFCYVVNDIHLKLFPAQLKTWSMLINEGSTDLETPPEGLAKTLMPAKSKTTNPFKDPLPIPPSQPILPMFPPQPHYPPYYQFYNPHGTINAFPPVSPMHQQMPGEHHPLAPATRALEPATSSPPSDTDLSVDKLTQYVQWLIQTYPTKAEQLQQCLRTLQAEDIVYGTLTNITETLYTTLGISHGIRMLLTSNQRKWQRTKDKGRV